MTATAAPEVELHSHQGARTIVEQPLVRFGPEIAADLDAGLRREWLVTNGLGGYASGTLAGVNTRPPLVTYHDFHALSHGGWQLDVAEVKDGIEVQAFDGATPFRLLAADAQYAPVNQWYWNFLHREETARGLDDQSDLYLPGAFSKRLHSGDSLSLVMTTESTVESDVASALESERGRQRMLLRAAAVTEADPVVQQLTLAADQFIVRRDVEGRRPGKSVIAGYHWFNDWGRDTMISLPGLTLSTGRPQDAAVILRTFARYVDQGILPNTSPDSLLRAGEPGVQLTWMDAKVGDWVVTPRIGKPVFAVALPHQLVDGPVAASVVDHVGRALLAGTGLRSLRPDDAAYRGDYAGDPVRRDSSYHQGPVWTWLLGPYAEAHFRVHGDRAAALALLQPMPHHLRDACLGNVSEILEGDAPHNPVGCVAQAWGVAETLRVWRALAEGAS